jgi:chemotaxis protein MotB
MPRLILVGMAALIGCAGISKEKYEAKEAEAVKYQQQLQEETTKASGLESQVKSLQQQNASLQGQVSSSQSQLQATQTKIAEQTPIRLNERLLFKEGSSKLTPESKRSLDAIADAIAPMKDKTVLIAGFTDNTEGGGKAAKPARWKLSATRSLEVAKYLAERGIDQAHVSIAGFGEAKAVAPNDTLANRALNRRVEVTLLPPNIDMQTVEVKPARVQTK